MDSIEQVAVKLWTATRSHPGDLLALGLQVVAHNTYQKDGATWYFWCLTVGHGKPVTLAFVGEGESNQAALDMIRAKVAEVIDNRHHAPMCPANHYHGMKAPTYQCTCESVGSVRNLVEVAKETARTVSRRFEPQTR